jgi:cell wall-associated NlpC family hydrolase
MELSKYIGVPYKDKGRTFKGADCYGILMLRFKEKHNIDLPEISATGKTPRKSFVEYLHQISKYWTEEKEFKEDYVIAMCSNENHPKMVTHFGIMIDNKTLLHTYEGVQSHIININHPSIKNQIKGIYKWHDL